MKPGNFKLEFLHDNMDMLAHAAALAMDNEVAHYYNIETVNNVKFLILYNSWNTPSQKHSLPFKLTSHNIGDFLTEWLHDLEDEDYPKEPDIDGSTEKGYYLFSGLSDCILRIRPAWGVYGK